MAKPWERREKEGAKAFAAFEIYRSMPAPERTFVSVATQCDKSASLMGKWCGRHEWVIRARAFDESVAALDAERLREKRVKELEETRERNRILGRLALARVTTALANEKKQIPITCAVDVYRMAKTGMMLEAAGHATAMEAGKATTSGDNRGEPEGPRITKLEVEIIGDGGIRISAEDIAAKLRSFYDKPQGPAS